MLLNIRYTFLNVPKFLFLIYRYESCVITSIFVLELPAPCFSFIHRLVSCCTPGLFKALMRIKSHEDSKFQYL